MSGAGEYRKQVLAERRVRCIHLLCKEAMTGIPEPQERSFAANPAAFWCDRTSQVLGPDGGSASALRCQGLDRSCYEPPAPQP